MPRAILSPQLCCLCLALAAAGPAPAIELPDLIAKVEPSVVRIEVETPDGGGIGSGFLTAQGVVTNYHVIEDATQAKVSFADKASAKVLGVLAYDASRDVAVLAVEIEGDRPPLPLCSEAPRRGEQVAAFGAPKGFSFTTSDGIISGLRTGTEIKKALPEYRYSASASWVQTTAAISPGNSGGPLVSARGEVVGMNSWTHLEGQNLNFAISVGDIRSVLEEVTPGKVTELGSLDAPAVAAPDKVNDVQSQLYAAVVALDFKPELQAAAKRVKSARADLATAYRSTEIAESRVSELEEAHTEAMRDLEKLRKYRWPAPTMSSTPGSAMGHPGTWFVFQVIGDQEALIKPQRRSDEIYYLLGVDTSGLVDGRDERFPGLWFVMGDTYRYASVGGSSKTVLTVRDFDVDEVDLQGYFRREVAGREVDKAIAALEELDPPKGAELKRLQSARARWELVQRRGARDAARAESEQRAKRKVDRAMRMIERHEELATKWLQDVIEQEPESASANRARRTLGIAPVSVSRTWTAGEHTTEAKLIEVNGNAATLEKPDGSRVAVPVRRLCAGDQEYIRCFAGE